MMSEVGWHGQQVNEQRIMEMGLWHIFLRPCLLPFETQPSQTILLCCKLNMLHNHSSVFFHFWTQYLTAGRRLQTVRDTFLLYRQHKATERLYVQLTLIPCELQISVSCPRCFWQIYRSCARSDNLQKRFVMCKKTYFLRVKIKQKSVCFSGGTIDKKEHAVFQHLSLSCQTESAAESLHCERQQRCL